MNQSGFFLWCGLGYIDPGTGAMALQWIIAVLLGAGVYFRSSIGSLVCRLRQKRTKDDQISADTSEEKKKEQSE